MPRKPSRDYRYAGASLKPTPLTPLERQILAGVPEAPEPSQTARDPQDSGARALVRAVLVDAIVLILGVTVGEGKRWKTGHAKTLGGRPVRGAVREARNWIRASESRVFGYQWCCEHLGLEPDAVAHAVFAGDRRALAPLLVHATTVASCAPGTSGSG